MAFTPNEYLITDPVEHLRCRQHAARTFVDDQFRLLPKNKFLFHVAFNVNWKVLTNVNAKLLETLKYEINLLVKNSTLPSYTVSSETLNQYNRKKVVQYQHKFGDIDITFHDDNMGLINQLWQAYYKYYYQDPTVSGKSGTYNKTATRSSSFITTPYGYKGPVAPFFNYITVYQMARHEYVSYKLVNPVITSWTGGGVGYHLGESHSIDMKLAYESVLYNTGYVDDGQMEGFGAVHYDWMPSPLSSKFPPNTGSYPSFASSVGATDTIPKSIIKQVIKQSPSATSLSASAINNGSGISIAKTATETTSAVPITTISNAAATNAATPNTQKYAGTI